MEGRLQACSFLFVLFCFPDQENKQHFHKELKTQPAVHTQEHPVLLGDKALEQPRGGQANSLPI